MESTISIIILQIMLLPPQNKSKNQYIQTTLQSFFNQATARPSEQVIAVSSANSDCQSLTVTTATSFCYDESPMETDQPSDANTTMFICSVTTAAQAASNDIGYDVSRILTAEDCLRFLNPWMPSKDADFPSSLHVKSGKVRKRRLLPHHLKYLPWLGVSKVEGMEEGFCIPLILLPNDCGIGGRSYGHGQLAGKLIARPLTDFDEITGKAGTLSRHQANEYHKDNVLLMENFKKTIVDGKMDIRAHINEAYQKEVLQNR